MRVLPLLLAAALTLPAADPPDRALLAGVVRDLTGAVLVDVAISATEAETGMRRNARTNGEGVYAIPSLAPGVYKVTARKVGFRTVARLSFQVASAQQARADFVLPVGSIREVITVEGAPAMTNADDGAVGTLVGKTFIDGLPINGRGILSLVDLSPGVVATPASGGEAGQFSVNGQRANTNYFTVDGVSANSGVSGSAIPAQFAGGSLPAMTAFGGTQNLVSVEALAELRIQTSTFAPEFGRMPGAQVSLTTRSGSDEFHGGLFHAFRNDALDANDRIAASHGQPRPPNRLNHWGASLGGPVRRHLTFFYAGYEGLRMTQPYAWRSVVPSLDARRDAPPALRPLLDAFPLPNRPNLGDHTAELVATHARPSRLDAGSLRIDHALSPAWNLFARYNQAPSSTRFGYSQVDHSEFDSRSVTLGATTMPAASLTNDLRVNVSAAAVSSAWVPSPAGGARPIDLGDFLPKVGNSGAAMYGVAIGGLGRLISGGSGRNTQGQWNIVETLALTRGTHALRIGLDYQRLTPRRESAALSIAGSYDGIADLMDGRDMLVTYAQAEQAASLIETLSVFAQDTWRATPRLTLTYGLRWELTPAPAIRQSSNTLVVRNILPTLPAGAPAGGEPLPETTFAAGAPLWPTRYSQFAPRVGVAYRAAAGTILRAGWGIFYDLGFSAATDPINGFPYNRWQFSTGEPNPVLLSGDADGNRLDTALRIPHAHHWNVAVEHAFSPADVVSASYVGGAGRNLLRREGTRHRDTDIARLVVATNHGASDYHGMQVQYRRRMSAGLQAVASYAWAHSIDNGSWDSALALAEPGLEASHDRGSSSFDVRHAFTAALSYAAPAFGPGMLGRATRHWTLHAMLRARSGFPIDVLAGENLLGVGFDNAPRPDLAPGVPVWIPDRTAFGGRRLNPGAFSVAPGTVQGNLGRNAISGFGMSQMDLAVERRFSVREPGALELRLEVFNALNHPNPADPVRYLRHPLFGQPASMLNLMLGSGSPHSGLTPAFQSGGARSAQITLKFRF